MNKSVRTIALYLLILSALAYVVATWSNPSKPPDQLSFNDFAKQLSVGRVASVKSLAVDQVLEGTYYKSTDAKAAKKTSEFTSTYIGEDALAQLMARYPDVTFTPDAQKPNPWLSLLAQLLHVVPIVHPIFYLLHQLPGRHPNAHSFRHHQHRRLPHTTPPPPANHHPPTPRTPHPAPSCLLPRPRRDHRSDKRCMAPAGPASPRPLSACAPPPCRPRLPNRHSRGPACTTLLLSAH